MKTKPLMGSVWLCWLTVQRVDPELCERELRLAVQIRSDTGG